MRAAAQRALKRLSTGRMFGWVDDSRGFVAIVVAVFLVGVIGLTALVIDLGQLIIVRSELQNAADSASLAGVVDLVQTGESAANTTAVSYATRQENYRLTKPVPAADAVVVVVIDAQTLQVRVGRTAGTTAGPLPTVFARIWGIDSLGVESVAVATVNRKIIGSGPGNLMPFGIHKDYVDADGDGNYDVGNVVDIYPHPWTPGNFGLLDLNGGANSNSETNAWIYSGYDDYFIIPEATGYVNIEGDPGISGGSLDGAISSRIGDEVVFPIFDLVTSQGANTIYRVMDLMGGIILDFKLTGAASQRYINVEIVDTVKINLVAGGPSKSDNASLSTPILIQ